ncbi:hypothetical protein P8605_15380 [Streptomyces sp. T-3]|nr:hypothetical protein [Streptomyces sp. T-3]
MKSARHTVRIPVSVFPVGLSVANGYTTAPASASKADTRFTSGFSDFSARLVGLTQATDHDGRAPDAKEQAFDPASPLARKVTFTVKEGDRFAALQFTSAEYQKGQHALSVYIRDATGKTVGSVSSPNSPLVSTWTRTNPTPGEYTAYVWASRTGGAADLDYRLTIATGSNKAGAGVGELKITPDPIVRASRPRPPCPGPHWSRAGHTSGRSSTATARVS